MSVQFYADDAPVQRWALARIEGLLLSATVAAGATWPFAVQTSVDRAALPGVKSGQRALPGRRVSVGEASRRGFVVASVDPGREEPGALQSATHDSTLEVIVTLRLPADLFWGGRRAVDVAYRVAADAYAAILSDRQPASFVVSTDPAGGMGLVWQEADAGEPVPLAMRAFRVRLRHPVAALSWPGAAPGEPADAAPVACFTAQASGGDPASVLIERGALTLRRTVGMQTVVDATLHLAGLTVASARDQLAAIASEEWTIGALSAEATDLGLGAELAEDLFVVGGDDALGSAAEVSLR